MLVLRDVLGYRAAEVAAMLETSEPAVNSALQRAQRRLLDRFSEAFEVGDVDTVLALLSEDAWIRMPPEPLGYNGRPAIGEFLRTRPLWRQGERVRMVPTRAERGDRRDHPLRRRRLAALVRVAADAA